MYGISSSGKEAITHAVEAMFITLAFQMLGNIPKLRNNPFILAKEHPKTTLGLLFLMAMGNKDPSFRARDVLKSLLLSSFGYMESLKHKTSSSVVEAVDAVIKEHKMAGTMVDPTVIRSLISKEMEKAQVHMKMIVEAESTKTRNMGSLMDIVEKNRDAEPNHEPNMFFIVRRASACEECLRLHMMPDGVIPVLYKMGELSMGYHKRGDDKPSACGEHPRCMCVLTELPLNFGFNKAGFVDFVSIGHDEYKKQNS